MNYLHFEKITRKWAVSIANWPLPIFCAPSKMGSKTNLDVLEAAWTNGTTYFHLLPQDELDQFCANYQCGILPSSILYANSQRLLAERAAAAAQSTAQLPPAASLTPGLYPPPLTLPSSSLSSEGASTYSPTLTAIAHYSCRLIYDILYCRYFSAAASCIYTTP